MFSAAHQAEAFLLTVYAGLAAGVTYDLLRLLRLSLRAGKLVTALLDVVFWVIAALLTGLAAALSGVKGLRFYLLLGAASGLLLWAGGVRRVMLSISAAICKRIDRAQAGKRKPRGEEASKRGEDATDAIRRSDAR